MPVWVDDHVVLAIHHAQIEEHGGLDGVRDVNALASALARPRMLQAYGNPTIIDLAAAYGFGLSRNHPFNDGNKRVSLVVTELFLALNGMEMRASDAEVVDVWLALAAGGLDEDQLSAWIRSQAKTINV